MLRTALLALGVVLLVGGVLAIPSAIAGAPLILALLFERYVYKPIRTEPPGEGWDKTGERFADPRSGRNVSVYFNPRTGARRYVADS